MERYSKLGQKPDQEEAIGHDHETLESESHRL
jgi:hypothetical protein